MAATVQRIPFGTESVSTASSWFDERRGHRSGELPTYDSAALELVSSPLVKALRSLWLEWSYERRPLTFEWISALLSSFEILETASRESLSRSLEIEKALTALKAISINLPQVRNVREYLLEHPDMTDLVISVCQMTSDRIGPQAELSLELYRDAEIEDEYLTLYVRQSQYDDRLLDTIEGISEPYEEELAEKSGWLLVTTDFRHPE